MHKLSVIMSTYKEPVERVKLSVDSILCQTFTDFEFIIVMDDPTNTDIEQLLNDYARADSRIVLLKNEKNLGLVASLNRMLPVATGEYVARMDADDIAAPHRFEKELAYLQANQLDIVGCLIHRMDDAGNPLSLDTRHYNVETVMHSLMIADCIPHSTWLLKREVYTALNGYRAMERCEDYDFLLRALKKGFRIGLCDEHLMTCRIGAAGISQSGLLEQRLASKYLTRHFHRIETIDMEEIRNKVYGKLTDTKRNNYRKADALFRKSLACRKTQPLKLIGLLIASLLVSPYQWTRLMDTAKLHCIRKKYH